ncbi:hypothetical protein, partial [Variovorax paradoxus]|uniref:hypothetical protein n=1 Tax=Variovorax paradoxus TaxID=34073 RepID=UPI0027D7F61A
VTGPRRSGQSGLPGTQENNRVGLRLKGLCRLKGKAVTAFAGLHPKRRNATFLFSQECDI